jgi:hypothetical protein
MITSGISSGCLEVSFVYKFKQGSNSLNARKPRFQIPRQLVLLDEKKIHLKKKITRNIWS